VRAAPKIAFAFPGQGSQRAGMGRELAARHPAAAAVFEEADRVLGFPLRRLCWEGPEGDLALTENTQPALLTVSTAVARVLAAEGIYPDLVLGHSLGEYSALVASGSLSFADALGLVRARGRAMQEAVPVSQGAMAALIGLDRPTAESVCDEARLPGEVLSPANYNGPGQVVVAGHAASVERAIDAARRRGARRAVRLNVSAPFHCALMKSAEERLAPELERVPFADLRVPLICNADARIISRGAEARDALRRQVCAPVRWEESVGQLRGQGIGTVVEVGPGRVLAGLIRRIDERLTVHSVEDEGSRAALRQSLSAEQSLP
jgi:[acyl-carrier-protein] S-malonyltransferase